MLFDIHVGTFVFGISVECETPVSSINCEPVCTLRVGVGGAYIL